MICEQEVAAQLNTEGSGDEPRMEQWEDEGDADGIVLVLIGFSIVVVITVIGV